MSHPDEGLIHAWLDGELDAAEAARIEALVKTDPAWAAAAADARGLIAASSRIVGKLDDVPGGVVPAAVTGASNSTHRGAANVARLHAAQHRGAPWWAMRVAALLVVATGTVLVVQRVSPDEAAKLSEAATDQVAPVSAQQATPLANVKADTPAIRAASRPALAPVGAARTNVSGGAAGAVSADRAEPSVAPRALRAAAQELKDKRAVPAEALEREADALRRRAVASGAGITAPAAAPAASVDKTRRDMAEVGKAADQKRLADSASGAGGATIGLRKESAALSLNSVLTTSVGDERRATMQVVPAAECFRETITRIGNAPVVHHVRRISDTAAVSVASDTPAAPPVAAQAGQAAQSVRRQLAAPVSVVFRVRADTLFVVAANGEPRAAIRISCPAP